MQKILSNPAFQLLLVIVVVGGVVTATQLIPSGAGGGGISGAGTNQENFKKFTKDIEELRKAPWDKEAYKSIQRDIDRYANNTPEPLLDGDQRKTLLANLTQAYIVTLNQAAIQFCKSSNSYNTLITLETETKQFKGIIAQSLLAKYRKALALIASVEAYTRNQAFNQTTYNALFPAIEGYTEMEYFKDNASLQKKVNYSTKRLADHEFAANQFKNCQEFNECDCSAKEYIGFNYYICQCEKKRCESKPDYEFNKQNCKCEKKQ
ncbi:MAG TPA: hypothetical protein DCS93_07110 [Microscillaceae bacterium]|nr:hypothetical protein [Microscillaceae bacterium]